MDIVFVEIVLKSGIREFLALANDKKNLISVRPALKESNEQGMWSLFGVDIVATNFVGTVVNTEIIILNVNSQSRLLKSFFWNFWNLFSSLYGYTSSILFDRLKLTSLEWEILKRV